MGYMVHKRGAYELAADLYRISLELQSERWVLRNLALAEIGAGQAALASSTIGELRKLAAREAAALEAEVGQILTRDAGQWLGTRAPVSSPEGCPTRALRRLPDLRFRMESRRPGLDLAGPVRIAPE